MEYILLKQFLSFIYSSNYFSRADTETYFINMPEGQLISLGDIFTDIHNRFKLSPNSMITRELKEGKNRYLVMDYKYEIKI